MTRPEKTPEQYAADACKAIDGKPFRADEERILRAAFRECQADARRATLEEAAKEVDRLAYASPNESRKITLEDTAARIRALGKRSTRKQPAVEKCPQDSLQSRSFVRHPQHPYQHEGQARLQNMHRSETAAIPGTKKERPMIDSNANTEGSGTTVEQLRALLEKATPGPWSKPYEDGAITFDGANSLLGLDKDGMAIVEETDDAALIVALRNAAPDLLRVVEAAQVYLAGFKNTCTRHHPPGEADSCMRERALRDALEALG